MGRPSSAAGRRFWIGVASRTHVLVGVEGGFAQVNHGKKAPLLRMHAGDGLAYYSPKTDYPDGEPLQASRRSARCAPVRCTSWGAAFRFGHLDVPEADFRLIAEAMGADLAALALA